MQIGDYTIVERLAVGGMAELFLATRSAGDDRIVVIKRLLPHLHSDDDYARMFIDEANLARRLRHPRIVETFELGRSSDELFIVMEYIDGIDTSGLMHQCARRGVRLCASVGVHIACCILEALDFAHQLTNETGQPFNVVHRDVSPSNVLLSRMGAVKLLDFGIAWTAQRSYKTKTGVLKGKYHYMSPEQVGEKPLDARSDLFSVGVVLAELLMGRRLFAAKSEFDVLMKVREADLARLDRYGKHIDPELDAIVRKALRFDPEMRFASAGEFRETLEQWRNQREIGIGTSEIARLVAKYYEACRSKKKATAKIPRKRRSRSHPNVIRRSSIRKPDTSETVRLSREVIERVLADAGENASLISLGSSEIQREHTSETPAAQTRPLRRAPRVSAAGGTGKNTDESTDKKGTGKDDSRATILLWSLEEPLSAGLQPLRSDSAPAAPEPVPVPVSELDQTTQRNSTEEPALADGSMAAPLPSPPAFTPVSMTAPGPRAGLLRPEHELEDTHDLPGYVPSGEGSFTASTSPIGLLYRLAISSASGQLTVTHGDIRKDIHFIDGRPFFVSSNIHGEMLGQYLLQEGVLSLGELSMALAMLPSYSGRLGDALVGLHLLTHDAFVEHLTGQVRSKLIDVCTWRAGDYNWDSDELPPPNALPLRLDLFEILGAGALALPDTVLQAWKSEVAELQVWRAALGGTRDDDFGLTDAIAALRGRIDGSLTIGELWEQLPSLSDEESTERCARALYLMVQTGMVALASNER